MKFYEMQEKMRPHLIDMLENTDHLFQVDIDKDEFWNLYLDSYPEGTNRIFRTRREMDCSCCRQFIKAFGNVVTITNGEVRTIWDLEVEEPYNTVFKKLSEFLKSKPIKDVFITKDSNIGCKQSYEQTTDEVITWNHFYVNLPKKHISSSNKSIPDLLGDYRDVRNVFHRSLTEISEDSIATVLELIQSNTLYKGEEWKGVLTEFLKHKQAFMNSADKDLYSWENSVKVGGSIGKIRNHSIGVLLVDISEGMDLDNAVKRYEKIVAPANYKRPKAIFTEAMLEQAKKTVEELGYMDSLARRYAVLDDITVNNILFCNRDSAKRIGGVFDEMKKDIAVSPKKFSRVDEISIEDFVSSVLPTATELEVLLENKHTRNMVSLIAPENFGSPSMFKWNNGFSWAYSGNITDSDIRENVKMHGGNIDGVLRFSIQWNDVEKDDNDLDAHCIGPDGNHIYYGNKTGHASGGCLDVDIQRPNDEGGGPAVENIVWTDKTRMPRGTYKLVVNNYQHRGGRGGFRAEIEFAGQVYEFDYSKEIPHDRTIQVAEVYFDGEHFTLKEMIPSATSTRKIWNVNTNNFIPVSVVMYSPNYWDKQNGIGHRHYFFMLKDCVNPELPNGFYNEFLKEDLMIHKRVFEALGVRMSVKEVADQLSGIGFSATKRNSVVVKIKGHSERVLKVNF